MMILLSLGLRLLFTGQICCKNIGLELTNLVERLIVLTFLAMKKDVSLGITESFADLAGIFGFRLESAKKEWPKATIEEILKVVNDKCDSDIGVEALEKFLTSRKVWTKWTIVGLSKALSRACNLVGVPAPEKLLAALANATELVVTFHNFDDEFQILEAGNEDKMADGSDDKDEDDEDE